VQRSDPGPAVKPPEVFRRHEGDCNTTNNNNNNNNNSIIIVVIIIIITNYKL